VYKLTFYLLTFTFTVGLVVITSAYDCLERDDRFCNVSSGALDLSPPLSLGLIIIIIIFFKCNTLGSIDHEG